MEYILHNDAIESYEPTEEESKMDELMCYEPYLDLYDECKTKIDSNSVREAIDAVIEINGEIAECNSKSIKSCSKCEAIKRKYAYCLREIEDMRDDLREQIKADKSFKDTPAEDKYDINSFMTKNYPTIERFPLSDVQKKYKIVYGLFVKQDELIKLIESTGRFTITVSKNIKFVNR